MQARYEAYTKYDWGSDKKWQEYLENLYPLPNAKIVEKRRRKFYQTNVDKDFNINYDPGSESSNAGQANQGGQGARA